MKSDSKKIVTDTKMETDEEIIKDGKEIVKKLDEILMRLK